MARAAEADIGIKRETLQAQREAPRQARRAAFEAEAEAGKFTKQEIIDRAPTHGIPESEARDMANRLGRDRSTRIAQDWRGQTVVKPESTFLPGLEMKHLFGFEQPRDEDVEAFQNSPLGRFDRWLKSLYGGKGTIRPVFGTPNGRQ
jgi:hypothetical protein